MEFVEHVRGKAPLHALLESLKLADGTELRVARWFSESPATRGTVLICTGRGEFIEKYFEVTKELLHRGFAVVVFDWRGQGRSSRSLRNTRKGHIEHFDLFGDDLAAVYAKVLQPFCPKPYILLAHSMGGAVALHHAYRHPGVFARIVLSAPMVEVHHLPFRRHLPRIVGTLVRAGLGRAFLPQGHRAAVLDRGFSGNILTSDEERFAGMLALVQADPELAVGAPTVRWLHAAFHAMARLQSVEVCRAITTPVLMIIPGADRVISVSAMERLGQRLKCCTPILIPHARHEILMERDELRDQFWAAFDAFLLDVGPVATSRTRIPAVQEPPSRRAG